MSLPLIILVTFIYAGVALSEWWAGRIGTSIMFIGYSLANVGVIIQVRQ